MTDAAAPKPRSTSLARLRRASEALRASADVGEHPYDDEAMAAALAEHLLLLAGTLPSSTPPWLDGWRRLARRHGVLAAPAIEEPTDGPAALADLRARLEQLSDRAVQSAARMCCER
jgi:hypothetical protein